MPETKTLAIRIEGMGCDHCVNAVKTALSEIGELNINKVEIGAAEVEAPVGFASVKIEKAIADAGYRVESIKPL